MTSFRRFGLLFSIMILLVAFITSVTVLQRRLHYEDHNNQVEIVLSYRELRQMAVVGGMSFPDLLTLIRDETEITSISLQEDSLEDFVNDGRVTLLKGSEVMNLYRVGHINRYLLTNLYKKVRIQPEKFYLVIDEKEDFDRLKDFLSVEYGKENVKVIGQQNILEVMDDLEHLLAVGLGVSKTKVEELESFGFSIVPLLKNSLRLNRDVVRAKFRSIQDYDTIHTVVFDGDSVLGYPDELSMVETKFEDLNLIIGMIEFSEQLGIKTLAGNHPYGVLRVHEIPDDELENYTRPLALNRYVRAVKERGVSMLFVRPFIETVVDRDIIHSNIAYFNQIEAGVKQSGKTIGTITETPSQGYKGPSRFEAFFISAGIFVVFLYTLNLFLTLTPKVTISMAIGYVLLYYFKDLLQVYVPDIDGTWNRGIALIAAVSFPTLAIITQFPSHLNLEEYPFVQRILPAFKYLFGAVLICLLGALFISAILSDITYLLGIRLFFGVKISFLLPLIFIGVFFFLRKQRLSAIYYVFKRLLLEPVSTLSFVAVFICFLFVVLYILRSGNYVSFQIPYVERLLRDFLESILFIRPRTKEILIGYPLLMFSVFYVDKAFHRNWVWFFNAMGSVALISFINSFCHFHTPIWVSFYRMFMGLVIGICFGFIFIVMFKFVRILFRRLTH